MKKKTKTPFVSICTPTFNRRPFYNMIIHCFQSQTYPKDRMEWVIIDDGTDKIEDIVKDIHQVKYFKYDVKMSLGKKRNLMHEKSKGDIIIYMDDDDFYPPERVSHAVEMLQKNPNVLIAGSSEMYIYFKHINKMYQFGPYGPNHATAATFAFRKELLKTTSYEEHAALAEEKHFLKNYTIPFIQLDPLKTILVFSHIHNSFDKKELLKQPENNFMKMSNKTIDEFIKNEDIKDFFINKIDDILSNYEQGKVHYKPEVLKHIQEIKENKNQMIQQQMIQHLQQMDTFNRNTEKILNEHKQLIQILLKDNVEMKKRISKLEENEIKKEIEEEEN
jgi:glycosyltransferase involved in cell wall biosynthesis